MFKILTKLSQQAIKTMTRIQPHVHHGVGHVNATVQKTMYSSDIKLHNVQ